jgi:protein arginine phosphatase
MAEAIARHQIASGELLGHHPNVFIASAGIQASDGMPPTRETLNALKEMGIEHDGRSKRLTPQMIHKADVVFCMTAGHQMMAQALVADSPADMDKVLVLNPDADLEDPIGMGQDAYDAIARQLMELIPQRLKSTLATQNRSRDQNFGQKAAG